MEQFSTLYYTLSIVSIVIFIGGTAPLLRHAGSHPDPRTQRLPAFNLLMWGLAVLFNYAHSAAGDFPSDQPMSVFVLTAGNQYAIFNLFYPLESSYPGWFRFLYHKIIIVCFSTCAILKTACRESVTTEQYSYES